MLEAFSKLVAAWFKPIRTFGIVMISASMVLLLRGYQPMGDFLRDSFWRWPLLAFIISAAGLGTYPLESGWKRIVTKRQRGVEVRRIIARLAKLTPNEKKVLGDYISEETRVRRWGRFVGTVDALAHDGILILIASDISPKNLIPDLYRINESAWEYLRGHPELVDLERAQEGW